MNILLRDYTYAYIQIHTQRSRFLIEKPTSSQIVTKFPIFYGTRRLINAFISARRLSLSWASSIQSITPNSTSWRSILILYSHLRHGLPTGLVPSGFTTKALYSPHLSPIHATCPTYLILLYFITRNYWVNISDHQAPHYVFISTPLLTCPS